MAKEIIVTQIKSAIKKPKRQKATLIALGCKKTKPTCSKNCYTPNLGNGPQSKTSA